MMPVLVQNRDLANRLLKEREALDGPTYDEVWDGVTVIMPEADIEHDNIAGFFYRAFWAIFGTDPANRIHFRVNLSDRLEGWTSNFRIPDTMVFLAGNSAPACRTHYYGGPDIALEVVSPDDRSRDKLDFYAKLGTREVIILDRDPWQLELYQLRGGKMRLNATAKPGDGVVLSSSVGPLTFEFIHAEPRSQVKIIHMETGQEWTG
jgi:Uma2 family endonuclease